MMTVTEIANKLVALCRAGKNEEALKTLFADNAVSVEADGKETKGLDNLLVKLNNMMSSWEKVHSSIFNDPTIIGNYFAVGMGMDVTDKKYGRMGMTELAVYETKDGKIIKEQFFYSMGSDKTEVKAVADKLIALCRAGKNKEALDTLYDENCVGTEAAPANYHETHGLNAIKENTKKWAENTISVNKLIITEPTIIGSNHFAFGYAHDITTKDRGRHVERELCVYETKDGKVVKEHFFY